MTNNITHKVSLFAGLFAAVIFTVAVVGIAFAQPLVSEDIPRTVIVMGFNAEHRLHLSITPSFREIENDADYSNFFGGNPPATPTVDFTKESVIAVTMGNQPNGFSIDVSRVEARTTGFTAGWAYVHVVQSYPPIGVTPPPGTVQPYAVYKVPKGAFLYSFVDDTVARDFDHISLSIMDKTTHKQSTIALDANGHAYFQPSNGAPIAGTATLTELTNVDLAVGIGNLALLPKYIPDHRHPASTTQIELQTKVGSFNYQLQSSLDYYGSYTTEVKPIVDALRAISNRLAARPTFDVLIYQIGGGIAPYSETVTVQRDGTTTVNRTIGTTGGTNYAGQASSGELQAIKDAFANADVTTLPLIPAAITDLNSPVTVFSDESFTSKIMGQTYANQISQSGLYGDYKPRVKPLVDSVRSVSERIVRGTNGLSIQGTVKVNATDLTVGSYHVFPSDPFYALFAGVNGKRVQMEAITGTAMSADAIGVYGTVTTADAMRAFPTLGGTVITSLPVGTKVEITDESLPLETGSFYELETGGQRGFVPTSSIKLGK